ncbi:MAG: ATP-binding protein [Planctomycetota bacterium]|nr:ATP-binding protein [Planctomycetota bacterium]
MRLSDFILANVEAILAEWEVFARSIWPHALVDEVNDPAKLRDHAEDILRATAQNMLSPQTAVQQSDKSKGDEGGGVESVRINKASEQHGSGRVSSGFELWAVVAEYRALRASVIRLWRSEATQCGLSDLDDLTRFNESIDQSLAEAVRSFAEAVDRDRRAAIAEKTRRAQELRQAKEEAETANRAKDIFLATLSHEMRTPLNAVVGWMGILRAADRNEADLAEGLDVIERNTRAQVQLIEDVLDVSRIVSGKLRLNICDCDLRSAIDAGIDAVRPAATARDITLEVKLDPFASRAFCDSTRMQQVVWNLLSNAIKFTNKGGIVRVTSGCDGSDVLLTVSDTGQGISSDFLPYIFDRFRQADGGTRRKFGGLGLGLSIVKHLVEMHGGTIEAQSAGENRGSTFTVRLPVKSAQIKEHDDKSGGLPSDDGGAFRENPSPPPVRLDGLRVLIVDDEADARRMLSKVLESVGAKVVVAGGAADALAKINDEHAVDVLVSDLGMPDQDGYDLIREIRRRGHQARDLPAVALTGFAHKDDAREAVLAGFQAHIPKPVDLHDLTAVIASLAGRTG